MPVTGGHSRGVQYCLLSVGKYVGHESSAYTFAPAAVAVDESAERPAVFVELGLSGKGIYTPHAGFFSPETLYLYRTSGSVMPPGKKGKKISRPGNLR